MTTTTETTQPYSLTPPDEWVQARIAEHFLPVLINGDTSGLEPDDEALLEGFLDDIRAYAPAGGFVSDTPAQVEDSENFARCEVTGLYANVVDVLFPTYRPAHPQGCTAQQHQLQPTTY